MSTATTTYKLDKDLIIALLEEIEASGVSRREFDLSQLVNNKSYIYGHSGSEKRRAIQKKFGEAKRKNTIQYLKFLTKFEVDPGEIFRRELLAINSEEEEEDSSDYSGSDDSSSISTKPSQNSTPKKPTLNIAFQVSPPPQTMQPDNDTYNTEASSLGRSSASEVQRRVEMLERPENKLEGTKENPYIIIANPMAPETCWGFEALFIPAVQVGNFVRNIYHIRHTTTQGMEDHWSATVPHGEYPALANRAILIRGPSQELWHRRPDLYHEESFCSQTALFHEVQQTTIKQSIERLYSYWMLVLPKGTTLENHVISHDSVHVVKGTQEMTKGIETEDDNGRIELETLYGMDVYWRIAVAGGNMVSHPDSATKKRRKKKAATKGVGLELRRWNNP